MLESIGSSCLFRIITSRGRLTSGLGTAHRAAVNITQRVRSQVGSGLGKHPKQLGKKHLIAFQALIIHCLLPQRSISNGPEVSFRTESCQSTRKSEEEEALRGSPKSSPPAAGARRPAPGLGGHGRLSAQGPADRAFGPLRSCGEEAGLKGRRGSPSVTHRLHPEAPPAPRSRSRDSASRDPRGLGGCGRAG